MGDWGMAARPTVPTLAESDREAAFAALQARLRPFESTDDPARAEERTVVAIPSINLDQEVLDRHVEDLPALEERCLYLAFALRRPRRAAGGRHLPAGAGRAGRLLPRPDP
jgi:hypothetical protein